MPKIAVLQHPPVLGDRDATLARAVELSDEAAKEGAELLVFPETYVPGYPTYIWRLRPGGDMGASGRIHDHMVNNAVDIRLGHLDPLCETAKRHGIEILVGCSEIDTEYSRSTIYNSYVHINTGNSCIIEPGGTIIAGPVASENAIIFADVDLQKVHSSRRSLDVAGHYNRPDVFKLQVNRQPQGPAVFDDHV
jgi:predicted amidohydrolase